MEWGIRASFSRETFQGRLARILSLFQCDDGFPRNAKEIEIMSQMGIGGVGFFNFLASGKNYKRREIIRKFLTI